MVRVLSFLVVVLAAGCSLVLEDPAPFVESRRDMAEPDMGVVLPDLAVEDAFVQRPPPDTGVDAAPDACTDAGCADAE